MKHPLFFIFIFILLTSLPAYGQNRQGKVVVHSDPRLLLLKRPKHVEPPATAKHKNDLIALNKTEKPLSETPNIAGTANKTTSAAPKTEDADETDKSGPAPAPENASLPASPKDAATPPENVPAPEVPETKVLHPTPWPNHKTAGPVQTTAGFRVQIYNGPERKKALEVKTDCQLRYPTLRSYLIYNAPSYKVRVGNFRNRADAAALLKQLKPSYSPIMIVPDKIVIGGL